MPITVVCNCGTRFDVPDTYVGRTGNCTSCGAPMVVRAPSASGVHPGAVASRPAGSGEHPGAVPSRPAGSGEHPSAVPSRPAGSGEHPSAGGGTATVGRKLGNYELVRKLGEAKSSVFLASSPSGQVAIKVLPQSVAKKSPTAGKRFLREARSLFGKEHPNIVKSIDAGEELGTYYLVMEFFQGRTLEALLQEKGGRLSEQEALTLTLEAAKGVAFLQSQGLVHRNIKPIHIMLGEQGDVKLVGMGLVRQSDTEGDAQVTGAGMIVGTPEYMSPEQAMSGDVDSRSDLYSLGTTLYRMLAGQTPFFDKIPSRVVAALVRSPAPSLQKANPEASNATTAVVERLLQKEADDRYATATDLVADIEAIKTGRLVAGLPPGFASKGAGAKKAPEAAGGDSVKKLVVIVGVLVVVVVVLVVVVVAMAMGGD